MSEPGCPWPWNQWYAAALESEVSGSRMLARTLCGAPVVLYRDPAGRPVALQDRCWHRLVPLSRGEMTATGIRCGYHGLEFSHEGVCLRIPGVAHVPREARVRRYEACDQDGYTWVWIGEEPASRSRPPRIPWRSRGDLTCSEGERAVACDFRLLVDNLLDASHLAYVHKDSLADPDLLGVPPELSVEGDTLEIRRWIPDYRPSPFYRRVLGDDLPSVRWQHTRFLLPAIVVNEGRVAPEGSVARWPEPDTGRGGYFINVITPVTPTSCHYFFSYVRNWEAGDAALTAAITAQLERIIDEDVALVEAQQLAQQSTPDLEPVFLGVDSGVRHARRLIARHAVSFRSTQLP
jgi:phenylpropionate dioxygenase-like ring-hydroxylating dioxygenase large terminal subunit